MFFRTKTQLPYFSQEKEEKKIQHYEPISVEMYKGTLHETVRYTYKTTNILNPLSCRADIFLTRFSSG